MERTAAWIDHLIEALEHGGREALAAYLVRQRWFRAKGRAIVHVRLLDRARLPNTTHPTLMTLIEATYDRGPGETYAIPMVVRPRDVISEPIPPDGANDPTGPILSLTAHEGTADVLDATGSADACLAFLDGIAGQIRCEGTNGAFRFAHTVAGSTLVADRPRTATRISAEQSNTSVVYDHRLILKLIRKLESGINPDLEVLEFLTTNHSYQHVPALVGSIQYEGPRGSSSTVGVLQTFIPNEGEGWTYTLRHLKALLAHSRLNGRSRSHDRRQAVVRQFSKDFLHEMHRLGDITGVLHVTLASDPSHPAFRPEWITQEDVARWHETMKSQLQHVIGELNARPGQPLAALGLRNESLTQFEARCLKKLDDLSLLLTSPVTKTRYHGDYHLGQVLKTGKDFTILDFEGEPARPLADRRQKASPLKDVAGMLRSFDYAANMALKDDSPPGQVDLLTMEAWLEATTQAFLSGYFEAAVPNKVSFLPPSRALTDRILRVFQLEKAVYELHYELNNRPDWIVIPLTGLRRLLQEETP